MDEIHQSVETGLELSPLTSIELEDFDLPDLIGDENETPTPNEHLSLSPAFQGILENLEAYVNPLSFSQPISDIPEQPIATTWSAEDTQYDDFMSEEDAQKLIPYTSVTLCDQGVDPPAPEDLTPAVPFKRALMAKRATQLPLGGVSSGPSAFDDNMLQFQTPTQLNQTHTPSISMSSVILTAPSTNSSLALKPMLSHTDPQTQNQNSASIINPPSTSASEPFENISPMMPMELIGHNNSPPKTQQVHEVPIMNAQSNLHLAHLGPQPGPSPAIKPYPYWSLHCSSQYGSLPTQSSPPVFIQTIPSNIPSSDTLQQDMFQVPQFNSTQTLPSTSNTPQIPTDQALSTQSPPIKRKAPLVRRKSKAEPRNQDSGDKIIVEIKQKVVRASQRTPQKFAVAPFHPFSSEPIESFKTWTFDQNPEFIIGLILALRGKLENIPNHVQHIHVTLYVKKDKSNWRCLYCAGQKSTPKKGWRLITLHAIGLSSNILIKSCPGCHRGIKPKNSIVGCGTCCCIWKVHGEDIENGTNFKSIGLLKQEP
ncbi:hypothetical protein QAD02_007204 [Eretmocerus hayati]|uniref:Uncharacterized protein n=1 Tax=Eretmocerus hayati TaxID=131215 RepID=A0ACC2N3C6_9HYME|nr:hypothetical protein QAD02_007204 [Eretmocerus hayati]